MKLLAIISIAAVFALPSMAESPQTALFDGKTLDGWKVLDFAGAGKVRVKEGGVLEIGMGDSLTGLVYTNEPVRANYEITLEGRRATGSDFFCGLTFPIGTNSSTLILGGWGGNLTGMSSINGMDASENQSTGAFEFEMNRWYKIRLSVTDEKIEAWVDEKRQFSVDREDNRFGMRWGDIEMCVPLGVATWQTSGELRNIKVRKLDADK